MTKDELGDIGQEPEWDPDTQRLVAVRRALECDVCGGQPTEDPRGCPGKIHRLARELVESAADAGPWWRARGALCDYIRGAVR